MQYQEFVSEEGTEVSISSLNTYVMITIRKQSKLGEIIRIVLNEIIKDGNILTPQCLYVLQVHDLAVIHRVSRVNLIVVLPDIDDMVAGLKHIDYIEED